MENPPYALLLFSIVQDSIAWWSHLSLGINCGHNRLLEFNFVSVKLATALWLLLWGQFILHLYQVNLKTYLSVADRLVVPFTDFDGFIQSLRSVFVILFDYNGLKQRFV